MAKQLLLSIESFNIPGSFEFKTCSRRWGIENGCVGWEITSALVRKGVKYDEGYHHW